MLKFWLSKYISVQGCLARACLFSLSRDLPGSFCPWEVSVRAVASRQFPSMFYLQLARSLALRAGSILLGRSLQSRPALQKAGFPGCAGTPLNKPPITCPSQAGTRNRVRAPATNRPEAHFPHPGRGGRQTSEGGSWGASSGDHRLLPRVKRRLRPCLQLKGRRGRERSFLLTQRQRIRCSPTGKGPRKLQQRRPGRETLRSAQRLGQGGEARALWQLPRRTRLAACGTGSKEGRGNVSQEVAGSTQGAGHQPGKAAWRLKDADGGGAGSRPVSSGWRYRRRSGCW